jgi:hypothetical protein
VSDRHRDADRTSNETTPAYSHGRLSPPRVSRPAGRGRWRAIGSAALHSPTKSPKRLQLTRLCLLHFKNLDDYAITQRHVDSPELRVRRRPERFSVCFDGPQHQPHACCAFFCLRHCHSEKHARVEMPATLAFSVRLRPTGCTVGPDLNGSLGPRDRHVAGATAAAGRREKRRGRTRGHDAPSRWSMTTEWALERPQRSALLRPDVCLCTKRRDGVRRCGHCCQPSARLYGRHPRTRGWSGVSVAHKIKPDTVRRGPGPCIVEHRCVIYLRLLRLPSHWRATRTHATHRDLAACRLYALRSGASGRERSPTWMASLALSAALVLPTVRGRRHRRAAAFPTTFAPCTRLGTPSLAERHAPGRRQHLNPRRSMQYRAQHGAGGRT